MFRSSKNITFSFILFKSCFFNSFFEFCLLWQSTSTTPSSKPNQVSSSISHLEFCRSNDRFAWQWPIIVGKQANTHTTSQFAILTNSQNATMFVTQLYERCLLPQMVYLMIWTFGLTLDCSKCFINFIIYLGLPLEQVT